MPYIIETFDKPGHQAVRQQQRAAHLEYLDANKGCCWPAAPLQDDGADAGGGLYLVDLDTREAAQQFIDADPSPRPACSSAWPSRAGATYVDGVCHL